MDADDVERVVEAEPVLQADREGADGAGDEADEQIEPIGLTQPAHGVIATRPATAPDAAPSAVDFPYRSFSTTIQPSSAVAVAVLVLTQA